MTVTSGTLADPKEKANALWKIQSLSASLINVMVSRIL